MEKQQLSIINFASQEEWDLTPKRVRDYVLRQKQRIEQRRNSIRKSAGKS